MLLTAALAAACLFPAAASATGASASKARHLTAAQRAKVRRNLTRQMKRNPGAILKRKFLKSAALVDFKLPMTVRFGPTLQPDGSMASDDVLELDWDDSVIPWPLAGGMTPPTQTSFIQGQFSLEASLSDDSSGYGELGSFETVQGNKISMTASPFRISDFQSPCADPQVAVPAGTNVGLTSAGSRYGLMNPFSQKFRGSLYLRMTFPSAVTDMCGGTTATTATVDNSAAPPMPVRFDGRFQMSPAVTAGGQMRVGKLTIDNAVTPQISNFGYVRACTNVLTCDPMAFPARLKIRKLTADVLLGDV